MSARRTFEQEWQSYRELCVHFDASEIQAMETRLAFYAGAFVLLGLLGDAADDDDGGSAVVTKLQTDVEEWLRDHHAYPREKPA